jgi:hypothetical protein
MLRADLRRPHISHVQRSKMPDSLPVLFLTRSNQTSFSGRISSSFVQASARVFVKHQRNFVLALVSVLFFGGWALATAQAAETRVALVIGNANYPSGALPTPAIDAGLIAQTLQAAGFDVTGVRDLDQDSLRKPFREFIAKVSAAGPIQCHSSTSAAMDCSWTAKITSCPRTPTSHVM